MGCHHGRGDPFFMKCSGVFRPSVNILLYTSEYTSVIDKFVNNSLCTFGLLLKSSVLLLMGGPRGEILVIAFRRMRLLLFQSSYACKLPIIFLVEYATRQLHPSTNYISVQMPPTRSFRGAIK